MSGMSPPSAQALEGKAGVVGRRGSQSSTNANWSRQERARQVLSVPGTTAVSDTSRGGRAQGWSMGWGWGADAGFSSPFASY